MVKGIIDWRPNSLHGPQSFEIDGKTFRVPARSQVKEKYPLVWVLSGGVVHVYSRLGEAVLPQGEGLRLAARWSRV